MAAQLKQNPQLSETRLIFLAAIVTREETDAGGSEIGGNVFLAKPIKAEELIAAIDGILG